MKTKMFIALSIFFIFSASTVFAALEQGTILITGDTSFFFSSQKIKPDGGDDESTTTIGLDVMGGYLLLDNIEVGVMFGYHSYKNGSDTSSLMLGLGGNYYFDIGMDPLYPYAGALFGYQTEDFDAYKVSGILFGFGGGAKYFFNEFVAADLGLKFTLGKGKYKNGYDVDVDLTEIRLFAGIVVKMPM